LHNIQTGDLVKIRIECSGRLGFVLAIKPSHRTVAHYMYEVEVLIGEQHYNFMMYELKKVG
jgi:hypothetical protein